MTTSPDYGLPPIRFAYADPPVTHEPRCNTMCQPGAHYLTAGIGYPHIHRTDLDSECGACVAALGVTENVTPMTDQTTKTRFIPPKTCPVCDGRRVWMDEPCECVIPPAVTDGGAA